MNELTTGLTGQAEWTVSENMTAAEIGSGLVAAFSTPMLVALMESAAVDALAGHLAANDTSVGVRIDIQHIAATPVGLDVRARAVLTAIDGRRLTFEIEAWDSTEQIGHALHERVIVDRTRFEAKLAQKS